MNNMLIMINESLEPDKTLDDRLRDEIMKARNRLQIQLEKCEAGSNSDDVDFLHTFVASFPEPAYDKESYDQLLLLAAHHQSTGKLECARNTLDGAYKIHPNSIVSRMQEELTRMLDYESEGALVYGLIELVSTNTVMLR